MSTLARIQDLAAKEFSIDLKSLDPHAQLDTLGIDSLSFIEFMFKVEEEFGVSVSDENLRASRLSPTSSVTSSTRSPPPARVEPIEDGRTPRRGYRGWRRFPPRQIAGRIPRGARGRALRHPPPAREPGARLGRAGRRTGRLESCAAVQRSRGGEYRPRVAVRAGRRGPGARREPPGSVGGRPRPHRRVLGHRHGGRAYARGRLQARLRRRRGARAPADRGDGDEQSPRARTPPAAPPAPARRPIFHRVALLRPCAPPGG